MKIGEPTAIITPRGVFLLSVALVYQPAVMFEVHLAAAGSQLPVWEQGSFISIARNLT